MRLRVLRLARQMRYNMCVQATAAMINVRLKINRMINANKIINAFTAIALLLT